NNTLNGGAGDDNLNVDYSTGNNLLNGDNGNDYLSASGYEYDNSGDEKGVYRRTSGNNTLNGGTGADKLIVDYSTGNNLLLGGDDNDYISAFGALGNNTLSGGNGNDTLKGGNGNDILTGGFGNDSLYGNDGNDTFVFNGFNQGVDHLYDFNVTNDRIQVSAADFGGGLSIGSLQQSQFIVGTSATTSNQRFIYDFSTGGLFFDQDGSASAFNQVKFAQLSAGLSLTNDKIVVA
ncbi:calcium-binding protein, partial [Nostoc sp. UIC 10630]|uniref:calcium-binding protein n=2 Tax=unclassified Nostoc TaxID=2593658 RepID=UPI0013D80C09